ncbi:MAG: histone deacetylase [Desulfobulbaceae bacterium]|uniref:Histone deacetylase n=1 Tax=Candidatus Desulfatifera sulfidica TaxID=2841691 RepID=A0A8J6TCX5_9BACT|nr:histone deacetylase [Candidatus Desulfatifera sulfidica]
MNRTALYRHPLFLAHDPGFDHVESAERLRVINEVLDSASLSGKFAEPDFRPATAEELALNHSQKMIERVAGTAGKRFDVLDPDTMTSADSYGAAGLAAGALISGLDQLMAGEIDNGFALVRPPGHHAERDQSMGFCLFNNVAVAAHYATRVLGLDRVMIVDWDLHHGNGTQSSFYESDKVLYVSSHLYPYYPGTGACSESGRGYTINIPLPGYQGDEDYAALMNEIVIPVGRAYKPQLILISCGFDIFVGDPLGTMQVSAKGISYLTRALMRLASEVCGGRLLVTLEGGYDLTAQREGTLAVLAELRGGLDGYDYAGRLSEADDLRLSSQKISQPFLLQPWEVAKQYWNL